MEELFGPLTPGLVLLMIVSLVEFLKRMGLQGNWSMIASLLLGVGLGVLFQLAEIYPAMAMPYRIAIYGLVMGLSACGLYDVGKRIGGR